MIGYDVYHMEIIMDPAKKFSFGFVKTAKPTSILKSTQEEEKTDVELIDYLEEQSIKVKNPVAEAHTPLVIPLRDDSKDLLDRIKQFRQNKSNGSAIRADDDKPDSELTLDELAARQLMREAKQETTRDLEKKVSAVPLAIDSELSHNDKESTLDDYNNVPVADYGMAMLRGMGWSESTGIGKDNKQVCKMIELELRPKGMGLGANKIINRKQELLKSNNGQEEELLLVKGSYAKVIAGSNKGNYCKVIGLDDESGRIIVEMVPAQTILPLNEFLLVPVSKEEFSKNSKVLNIAKYEAYVDKLPSSPSTSRAGASSGKHRSSKRSDNNDHYHSKKKRRKSKDYDEEKKYKHKKTKKHKRSRSRSREDREKKGRHNKRNRSNSSGSSDEDNSRRRNSKRKHR